VSSLEAPRGEPGPTGGAPRAGRARLVRHPARWVAGGVLAVLVVVAVVAATRPSFQATQVSSPLVGRPAPPIAGSTFGGGQASLASYRGRFVYVNFFASWCPSCQSEMPDLVDFWYHQQRADAGAALLSVDFDDSIDSARKYVTQWGVRWPVVADHQGVVANDYGVSSPPTTFLVNPRGTVVGVWKGPVTVSQLNGMLAASRAGGRGG
jgi:cytochrome c biogenesis protein CcmG, thiol:disulfide interchange protein DsbE